MGFLFITEWQHWKIAMKPFLSENSAIVQIYLCTIMKDA